MPSPVTSPITCPNCGVFLPLTGIGRQALSECPGCHRPTEVTLFPAYERPAAAAATAQKVIMEGEATCFYHTEHRAHVPCDACGRFLCALCDLELNGRHLCPPCLEKAMAKSTDVTLERSRTRWDKSIFSLLILPLITCYLLVPATSLTALGLIIWKWKAPGSLVSNTKLSFIICAIVAVLELAGSLTMWWFVSARAHR